MADLVIWSLIGLKKYCIHNKLVKLRRFASRVRFAECDIPVPGILLLFGGTGTGTGKKWSRKKVLVPASEKIGPGTVEFPGVLPGHCIF